MLFFSVHVYWARKSSKVFEHFRRHLGLEPRKSSFATTAASMASEDNAGVQRAAMPKLATFSVLVAQAALGAASLE